MANPVGGRPHHHDPIRLPVPAPVDPEDTSDTEEELVVPGPGSSSHSRSSSIASLRSASPVDERFLMSKVLFEGSKAILSKDELTRCQQQNSELLKIRHSLVEAYEEALKLTPLQQSEVDSLVARGEHDKALIVRNQYECENVIKFVFVYDEDGHMRGEIYPDLDADAFLLGYIFYQLYDREGFVAMDAMRTFSRNKDFKDDIIVNEFFARSLLRSSNLNTGLAIHIVSQFSDQAYSDFLLPLDLTSRAEFFGIAGRAYHIRYDQTKALIKELKDHGSDLKACDPQIRDSFIVSFDNQLARGWDKLPAEELFKMLDGLAGESLRKSEKAYRGAFLLDFDPGYGTKLLRGEIELREFDTARKTAQTLFLAAMRDGGLEATRLNVKLALLESSIMLFDNSSEINAEFVGAVLESIGSADLSTVDSKRIGAFISKSKMRLDFLKGVLTAEQKDNFDHIVESLEKEIAHWPLSRTVGATAPATVAVDPAAKQLEFLLDKSFSYRGMTSNYIDGNFRFGGQLSAHNVNRMDRLNFENLLKAPLRDFLSFSDSRVEKVMTEWIKANPGKEVEDFKSLSLESITDVDMFMRLVDLFVRRAFRTEELELEDLHSDGHKVFDKTTQNLISLMGMSDSAVRKAMKDSRTSLSVSLALGLGDCRHHAQAKQMLFDTWQRCCVNQLLAEYRGGGDESLGRQIHDILNLELRTFDVEVHAPVEMKALYDPVLEELDDGKKVHVMSDREQKIEEHTMNILLKRDDEGRLVEARFADSFYQDHYHWADGRIDFLEDGGVLSMAAKDIAVMDMSTGAMKEVDVRLAPTAYAGKRDRYQPGRMEQMLLGQPVDRFDLSMMMLSRTRARTISALREIGDWGGLK